MQLTAFALGIMMLLLLAVVRNDLLNDWRRSLPADTPNFFFINIPPDEHQAFTTFLEERGAQHARARPMVRARMTQINGKAVDDIKFATRRGREFANRDQNITWAEVLGNDNVITAGRWFTPEDFGKPLVSVSTEYMEEMNLKLGDELQFDIAGETRAAKISSVRDVKWDSFQPNFFLMFAPGMLEGSQGTWMTATHLSTTNPKTISDLVRRFPSVSVFNVDDLLRQVRAVIDKAVAAVQSVFLFTLMAGLVVLVAAVQASREERRYESAMLRTLGAQRSTVLKGLLAEFAALGVLSGTLAAAGASIAGALYRDAGAADSLCRRSVGVDLRPRGRRLVSLLRRLAGDAVRGEPAARADTAGWVMAEGKPVKRRSMVGWYDPRVLAHSAYKLVIANIFGRHSDTRLIEALASQPQNEFDYSAAQGDFWFDYAADIGDGWNSTYAVADAIARPELLYRATEAGPAVLVFGGDEVYPYPTRAEYDVRTETPYRMAFAGRAHPDVFAIPGNHDWYDSLVAFSRTFCRPERGFAGCATRQTRSYFALKLPANWWLLAIDLQLGADLDEPQVQYFQKVASRMDDAARLIFCVPEPRWILEDAYPQPLELRRAVEHAFPRRESVQAQGARVPHRRSALLQAARERGRNPEDHLGRWRRLPASHACAVDASS